MRKVLGSIPSSSILFCLMQKIFNFLESYVFFDISGLV